MQLRCVLLLACGLAAQAFSVSRVSSVSTRVGSLQINGFNNGLTLRQNSHALKMSSDAVPADPAPAAAAVPAPAPQKSFIDKIWTPGVKVATYLMIWYVGNIYYNIYNKKACIALGKNAAGGSNLHWLLSAVQLLVGVLFVIPQWYVQSILICISAQIYV